MELEEEHEGQEREEMGNVKKQRVLRIFYSGRTTRLTNLLVFIIGLADDFSTCVLVIISLTPSTT